MRRIKGRKDREKMTVGSDSRVEFTEKKSVFIGQAFFVLTEEEAEARINDVRGENPQATHVCFAYSLGNGAKQRFSDDGEPSGTAGMPILHVINSNNLSEALITVTRYFGGILLGAGGLVRAYSRSAADAITEAGKTEIIPYSVFTVSYGYDLNGKMERDIPKDCIIKRDFSDSVTLTGELPSREFSELRASLEAEHYKYININEISVSMKRKMRK